MPSLGMLTVNALAAADTALIPVQAQYLSAKGLEQLLQTVQKVRRQINPKLRIEGILLTIDGVPNLSTALRTASRTGCKSSVSERFHPTIFRLLGDVNRPDLIWEGNHLVPKQIGYNCLLKVAL